VEAEEVQELVVEAEEVLEEVVVEVEEQWRTCDR
jgi:hypothetical protein